MINNVGLIWEWDKYGSNGYNAVGKLETTLINMGVIIDYSDIVATENFDNKHSARHLYKRLLDERFTRYSNQFNITN